MSRLQPVAKGAFRCGRRIVEQRLIIMMLMNSTYIHTIMIYIDAVMIYSRKSPGTLITVMYRYIESNFIIFNCPDGRALRL